MITLREVDDSNIWDIIKLSVYKHQEDFVATNTESILEAYVVNKKGKVAIPLGIYEKDLLIGFVMFGYGRLEDDDPSMADDSFVLWRFMIDKKHQQKGLGKRALEACMSYLKESSLNRTGVCWTSYEPYNEVARSLYLSYGFKETDELCDGETVAVLNL